MLSSFAICVLFFAALAGCRARSAPARAIASTTRAQALPPSAEPATASSARVERARSETPATRELPSSQAVPRLLSCLARWYDGHPSQEAGQWWLELGRGTRIRFDDGVVKSFDQRLTAPDLEDTFAVQYTTNRNDTPVSDAERDPGRSRVEALFKATYGETADAVARQLVDVQVFSAPIRVHAKIADPVRRVVARVTRVLAGLEPGPRQRLLRQFASMGTFNFRAIAGTERLSAHAFGIAIDLNPALADYWRWSTTRVFKHAIPREIVDAFEAEGFIWGGSWYHFDTMHFEFRPELLDPDCVVEQAPVDSLPTTR